MKAKEMFEKLGYMHIIYRWGDIGYIQQSNGVEISFYSQNKVVEIISNYDTIIEFKTNELKAINKQIEELGWDNE